VRELLRALAAREDRGQSYVLYSRSRWEEPALDERFSWRTIAAREPLWHVRTARRASRECDVFLSTNSYLTPLFLRIPAVTIVYDLTTFEPTMRPNRRSTVIERLTLGPAVRRSAAMLSISQATADALVERFPAARDRVVVAPLGVTPALSAELAPTEAGGSSAAAASLRAEAASLPIAAASLRAEAASPPIEAASLSAEIASLPAEGFVLAVGTLEPRKNLPRLVDAYRSLGESLQREHPLVVVGALGWETGETLGALRGLGERCTMLGHVSDAALAELYRRCAVFCYPSLGEGFGLPVLEAMAAGAAVLTSNVSSLPEVGGDAVEYADPSDVAAIAAGLERLLGSPALREKLGARALARSREFSWARFAESTLAALGQAAQHASASA
jgi:glycosyltransferase involved in cell wall biosynthesis